MQQSQTPMGHPGMQPQGPGGQPGPAPEPTPFGPMGNMPMDINAMAGAYQQQAADLEGRTGQQP